MPLLRTPPRRSGTAVNTGQRQSRDEEAAEYVESVMAVQNVASVPLSESGTCDSSRKRNRSGEDVSVRNVKKAKDGGVSGSQDADSGFAPGSVSEQNVIAMLNVMSTNISTMFEKLDSRMCELENNIEKKITARLAQIVDKRVSSEASRLRKEFDSKLDSLRTDCIADSDDINDRISNICKEVKESAPSNDIRLNIVIRNLQESANENLDSKVNGLIRDGLRVNDVVIDSAIRKPCRDERRSGVVVARMKCQEDKMKVMGAKTKLKNSRTFSNVFINHDQSREERLMAANFRAVVDAVRGGKSDINIVGSRVVQDRRGFSPAHNAHDTHDTNNRSSPRDRISRSDQSQRDDSSTRGAWHAGPSESGRGGREGQGQRQSQGQGRSQAAARTGWPAPRR